MDLTEISAKNASDHSDYLGLYNLVEILFLIPEILMTEEGKIIVL